MQTATEPDITTTAAASFPAEAATATWARHFVTGFLEPHVRDDALHVAALLTTELATNSLLHARTAVDVAVSITSAEIRVEVRDAHPDAPHRVHAGEYATHGRGLELVEALSESWGVAARGAGKGVWFALAR